MRRKTSALVVIVIAGLVLGGAVLVAPSVSHAGTINTLEVTNGGAGDFTGRFGAGPLGNTWNLGAAIVLPVGGTAVFTQNQAGVTGTSVAGYNFDTSDKGTAAYHVLVNGVSIADPSVLNQHAVDDPNSQVLNESHGWLLLGIAAGFDVYVGYADTLHNGTGGLCQNLGGGNCLPFFGAGVTDTWDGTGTSTAATVFLGHGAGQPFAGYTTPTHCTFASNNCFDGGAIMLVERPEQKVPEPSSLLLIGVGLLGVAAYGRRRLKRNS